MKRLKILIVDDHPLVRSGLVLLINQQRDMKVCGEADDRVAALAQAAALRPDVAVVDITLKNSSGIDLVKDLRAHDPKLKSLVLSAHEETLYAERALEAGARGYVRKTGDPDDVLAAIRTIATGRLCVSEAILDRLLDKKLGGRTDDDDALASLSDRELEVFTLLGEGKCTREVAALLGVSHKTVESYREHIKAKLGLKDSIALILAAGRHQDSGTR